ncbi:RNA polymerase II elongation factor ELL2 isoform X6 [Grus americana]|uniref:RNA polymerase II elongation factor ELL2 isoform X6 n=1 Tax=Grus americana TaxID=9117 RepID=UPI002407CB84|nr:RNA polymerase II elongation factor ELL2 isoform X6 [Grus americana]XP_054665901.1 RNA polymerase II elongation factor ELL2 isoform X6 [Grus americana]
MSTCLCLSLLKFPKLICQMKCKHLTSTCQMLAKIILREALTVSSKRTQGKRVPVRRPPQSIPDAVPERKRSTPMNPANTIRRTHTHNAVSQRPYRDRVIHLLALKSYKKPELLARLQRDGVNQKDKNSLGIILQQVANLNPKDNSYTLKDYIFKDIQKDWPGYNEIDKQSLELILSRKLNSSQNATSTSHLESSVTSNDDGPSTSSQKRLLNSDFIDPLMNKKQRISHLNSRAQLSYGCYLPASVEKATAAPPPPPPPPPPAAATTSAPLLLPPTLLPTSTPPQAVSSTSSNTPERRGTQDMSMDSFSQNSSGVYQDQQKKHTSQTLFRIPAPPKSAGEKRTVLQQRSKKVQEYKGKDESKVQDTTSASREEKDLKKEEPAKLKKSSGMDSDEGVKETCSASIDGPSSSEQPDYFKKYVAIVSYEQRQSYKNDFYAEYDEYRNLHARIENTTRKFVKLDAQRKLLSPGSKEYQMLHEEVLEEYRKVKQSTPNYYEEKYRCEYLHNKLSHIKRLIGEYDEQQAESLH